MCRRAAPHARPSGPMRPMWLGVGEARRRRTPCPFLARSMPIIHGLLGDDLTVAPRRRTITITAPLSREKSLHDGYGRRATRSWVFLDVVRDHAGRRPWLSVAEQVGQQPDGRRLGAGLPRPELAAVGPADTPWRKAVQTIGLNTYFRPPAPLPLGPLPLPPPLFFFPCFAPQGSPSPGAPVNGQAAAVPSVTKKVAPIFGLLGATRRAPARDRGRRWFLAGSSGTTKKRNGAIFFPPPGLGLLLAAARWRRRGHSASPAVAATAAVPPS